MPFRVYYSRMLKRLSNILKSDYQSPEVEAVKESLAEVRKAALELSSTR